MGVFILVFELRHGYCFSCNNLLTLYMNYPRCGDCAFSASFVKEGTDVRYVAEGVELTVHKESVVIEEIKEVELRSRREQIYL